MIISNVKELSTAPGSAKLGPQNSANNPKPILNIARIDAPYQVLFFVLAWTLIPPAYNPRIPKTINAQVIADYKREFRRRAQLAGVAIGRRACLDYVLSCLQRGQEKSIKEHEKARALMAAHLYKQYNGGE